jgi:exonuclease VII large subunit
MAEKLAALGPASVLSRGYSYAVSETGTPLSSAKDFHPGQGFRLVMADGSVDAVVSESDEKAE